MSFSRSLVVIYIFVVCHVIAVVYEYEYDYHYPDGEPRNYTSYTDHVKKSFDNSTLPDSSKDKEKDSNKPFFRGDEKVKQETKPIEGETYNFKRESVLHLLAKPGLPMKWDDDDDFSGSGDNFLGSICCKSENVLFPEPLYFRHPSVITDDEDLYLEGSGNSKGYVMGKEMRTALTGKLFRGFFGLRYGTVSNALEKAQPIDGHAEIYDHTFANVEPTRCPSLANLFNPTGPNQFNVNDCLTLSVFTPDVSDSYPVLIYIHGDGLFDASASKAKPENLLENDIVLVVVKYRLASFGFLATATGEIVENLALSDLELATSWVMDNIAALDGNSRSISIVGDSGAASLIHALSSSEKLKSKFLELLKN